MQKTIEFAKTLQSLSLTRKQENEKLPSFVCHTSQQSQRKIKEKCQGELYEAFYQSNQIHFKPESPLAAAYGMSQLSVAIQSGYTQEFLGPSQPLFPLRPLWLAADSFVSLNESFSLGCPSILFETKIFPIDQSQDVHRFDRLCERIIELGYNAVILGQRKSTPFTLTSQPHLNLQVLCEEFHDYGLKVIIKPSLLPHAEYPSLKPCPFNQDYRCILNDAFANLFQQSGKKQKLPFDYLLWESDLNHPHFSGDAQEATQYELVLAELTLVEDCLKGSTSLIYYIPSIDSRSAQQQARWLPTLCDDAGNQTILAFSALEGDPTEDHLPPHPFWNVLRKNLDCSSTPLLPLLNIGCVNQGEGLWPTLTLDLIEEYIPRLHTHPFAGVIGLVNTLPQSQGLLSCSLWVAGQSLWHKTAPHLLAEMWFSAFHPDVSYSQQKRGLKKTREISKTLSQLRALIKKGKAMVGGSDMEEFRYLGEMLEAELKFLKMTFGKPSSPMTSVFKPSLTHYIQYFIRDAFRTLTHFLNTFHLPANGMIGDEIHAESFWTQASSGNGFGVRLEPQSIFLDKLKNPQDSIMKAIIAENRI